MSSINLAAGTQNLSLQADGNWGPGPKVSSGAGASSSNGLSIDATVLGAMTAGQIRIVSTDAGMGVNLRGALNAYQQGIDVSSNGALNLAEAAAVKGLQLSANGHLTTGSLSAGTTIDAQSGGAMTLGGNTRAGGDIKLQAGADLTIANQSGSTFATQGNLLANSGGNLYLGSAQSQISVAGNAELRGVGLAQQGRLDVGNDLTVEVTRDAHLAGDVNAGHDLKLDAGGRAVIGGSLRAGNDAAITATDIEVAAHLQVGRNATLRASDHLSFNGSAQVGNEFRLAGSELDLAGQITAKNTDISGQSVVLGAGGSSLDITGGLALDMKQNITVNGALDVQGNARFTSGQDTSLNGPVRASGAFSVNAGGNATVGAAGVQAGSVQMSGRNVSVGGDVLSATTIALSGTNDVTVGGKLAGGGDVNASAGGAVQIGGAVQSGGNVSVAGSTVSVAGDVQSQGDANLQARDGALAIGGSVSAGGDATLAGAELSVAGSVQSQGAANITARSGAVQIQGDLLANKALTLSAGTSAHINGRVASGGASSLSAQGALTIDGALSSGGATTVHSGASLTVGGDLKSAGALQADAAGAITVQGQGLVLGDARIRSGGAQTWGGDLGATGALDAAAAAGDIAVAGTVGANGALTLDAGGAIHAGALSSLGQASVAANGDIAINGQARVLGASMNSRAGAVRIVGDLDSQQDASLQARGDLSLGGKTTVGGDLQASSSTGSTRFAQALTVGGDLNAHAKQDLVLQGESRIVGTASLAADQGQLLNQGALTVGQGLSVAQTGDFVNTASVQVRGDTAIEARNIRSNLTGAGTIASTGKLNLNASERIELGAQSVVTAKDDITLAATQGLTQAGQLSSGAKLDYQGGTIANSGSMAANSVTIAAALSNSGSLWGETGVRAANTSNTAGASIGSGGSVELGSLDNAGAVSGAGISAQATTNAGSMVSSAGLTISGGLNNSGTVSAQGDLGAGGGQLSNTGQISASNVNLNASSYSNAGVIQAADSMQVAGGALHNDSGGQINAGSTLAVNVDGGLTNSGRISSGAAMNVQTSGALGNAGGQMLAGQDMALQADSLSNDGGVLQAATRLQVNATGAISNGVAAGSGAGSMRGAQISLSGASVSNQGLIQASSATGAGTDADTGGGSQLMSFSMQAAADSVGSADSTGGASGSLVINASGNFSSSGAQAVLDASTSVTISAKSIDNGAGAKIQATQSVDLTASAGSVNNAGTIYGSSGAPAEVNINANGGAFNNSGTVIADKNLTINSTGYSNTGTVGSRGDATLSSGGYDPDNAITVLGTLDINSGFTIAAGKGWASSASLTRWSGKITNFGSLYLAGSGAGDIDNLSSGQATNDGAPPRSTAYAFNNTPPDELSNAQIVSHTDVETRAQVSIRGTLDGTLRNRASDAAMGGGGYTPENVGQTVTWRGTVWDSVLEKDVSREVTVASASLARMSAANNAVITLTGPESGSIVGNNLTIKGADLTLGTTMNNAASRQAMALARERQVSAGSSANAQAAGSQSGSVAAPDAQRATKPLVPSAEGLAAANEAGHINTKTPNLAAAQGATEWLGSGWPAGRAAPQFPDWDALGGVPNTVSANTLNLDLTGKFTNAGYFGVKDDLIINAAKGVDNESAHLRAGGTISIVRGGLNNRDGSVDAGGGITGDLTGDIDNTRGRITAANDIDIHTSANAQASEGSIESTGGSARLDADGNINLEAGLVRGAQGAQVLADGNINLGATQEGRGNTDEKITTRTETRQRRVGSTGGETDVAAYEQETVDVKDKTVTTTTQTLRNRGTVLDGGAGNLTVTAGGNVTGRGSEMTAQGHTEVTGQNVDIAALVDRTTTQIETVQHGYGEAPVERSTTVQESLAGGTVKGGKGVSIVARSSADGQGNVSLSGARMDGGAGGATVLASGNVDAKTIALHQSSQTQKDALYTDTRAAGGENAGDITLTYKVGSTTDSKSSTEQAGSVLDGGTGNLSVIAGGNVTGLGSDFKAGGTVSISGRNVSIEAAKDLETTRSQEQRGSDGSVREQSNESLKGGQVQGAKGLTVIATGPKAEGQGNVRLKGATLDAGEGQAYVKAAGNITAEAQHTEHSSFEETRSSDSGLLSHKSTHSVEQGASSLAHGTAVTGDTVVMRAGGDITVQGSGLNEKKDSAGNVIVANSGIISKKGTDLEAGGDVNILADEHSASASSHSENKTGGLFGGGGALTFGSRKTTTDKSNTSTQAAGSTIASTEGNVRIRAGGTYNQVGSDISTPKGDQDIEGKHVNVSEAREVEHSQFETRFRQSGVSLGVSGALVDTARTVGQMAQIAGRSDNSRTQLLAGAAAALKISNNANQIASDLSKASSTSGNAADAVSLSISLGTSQSQSRQTQDKDSTKGSQNAAGGNISLRATEGNVLVRGSQIDAAGKTSLIADKGAVLLEAAANTNQEKNSSSSSASIGLALGSSGTGVNVSASMSRTQGSGGATSYTNTHVRGGQEVHIDSAGDTSLKGAVISAPQVTGKVDGKLLIESLQDTSKYNEKGSSAGISVTVGPSVGGGSLSLGRTSINSDYASVGEQSAIRAGDGGFQLQVEGRTELKGGAITSTQAAVDAGRNQFAGKGGVQTEDMANSAAYNASSVGGSLGVGSQRGGGMGGGRDSGKADSTTQAGITGVAGNTAARTGDAETGIKPIFDKDKTKTEVQDQVSVTQQVGREGATAWGDYSNTKFANALKSGDEDGMKCWGPDGGCRAVGHAVIGGATGGTAGAAAAAGTSMTAPHAYQALIDAGVPPTIAQSVTALGAAAVGGTAGGAAGAAAATNEAANNTLAAIPAIVEIIAAAGTTVMRACAASPACIRALGFVGVAAAAKTASDLTAEEQAQTPGHGTGQQPQQNNNTGNTEARPDYGSGATTPNNGPEQAIATPGYGDQRPEAGNNIVTSSGADNSDKPSLLDQKGEQHILDGDGPNRGGGHRPGTGKPGKSEFPSS